MKTVVIILGLMGCSAGVFAQVNKLADSLYFLQTGKHLSSGTTDSILFNRLSPQIYFNPLTRNNNHFSLTNTTQLVADTSAKTGLLQFYYRNQTGDLHPAQTPFKSEAAGIYTEGFATLGRVKLSGRFRFARQWKDSLANNLGMHGDGMSPYYYFTPKAGTYEGQYYDMSAAVAWNVVKAKLYLGVKADYTYRWVTGSVDPRLDDKTLKIRFYPSLTYQAGSTFLGVEYLTGYGYESMNIKYKSDTYNFSTLFPERFYYLNMGYGNIALKYDVIDHRDIGYRGLGINFSTTMHSYNIRLNFLWQKEIERNKKDLDTLKISDLFSKWYLNRYTANALVTRKSNTILQQLSLKMQVLKGNDFNSLYNGSNYSASRENIYIKYDRLHQRKETFQWRYGAFIEYTSVRKHDILASHIMRYTTIHPGISGGIYLKDKSHNLISFAVKPSLILPVINEIAVPPTQINVFTQGVAFPDYYYHSTRRLDININFHLITPHLIGGMQAGLFLEASYLQKLSVRSFRPVSQKTNPGKNCFNLQTGFNVYL